MSQLIYNILYLIQNDEIEPYWIYFIDEQYIQSYILDYHKFKPSNLSINEIILEFNKYIDKKKQYIISYHNKSPLEYNIKFIDNYLQYIQFNIDFMKIISERCGYKKVESYILDYRDDIIDSKDETLIELLFNILDKD